MYWRTEVIDNKTDGARILYRNKGDNNNVARISTYKGIKTVRLLILSMAQNGHACMFTLVYIVAI